MTSNTNVATPAERRFSDQVQRWMRVREIQVQRGIRKLEAFANESDDTKGDL